LWCEADREGLLEWKPKTLRLRYFPGDTKTDFEKSCKELVGSGLIELYEVDGKEYCEIPTFTEHQVINNREIQSNLPKKMTRADACTTRESGAKAEGRKEGKERKGKEGRVDDAQPEKTQNSNYAFEGKKIRLNHDDYRDCQEQYPNLDLPTELRQLDLELSQEGSKWFMAMHAKLRYRNQSVGNKKSNHPDWLEGVI
jgi:hypothetical protein